MIFSLKAPYDLEPFGHAWYAINFDAEQGKWSDDEQAKESREKIVTFIDEAIDAYDLDKSNITLLGFSQGTILSYAVALSYPEKVKNVIALSTMATASLRTDSPNTIEKRSTCTPSFEKTASTVTGSVAEMSEPNVSEASVESG